MDAGLEASYDTFPRIEEEFGRALDESLDPRGPDVVYEVAASLGLPAGAVALDVGCGAGDILGALKKAVGTAIRDALAAQGTPGIVLCHLSHAYADGASLYFTFIAAARHGAEIAQWDAVKRAASEAIVASGGTITHHHSVGRDHAPWYRREVPGLFLEGLGAAKDVVDPAGIMNPGKLLPPSAAGV